MLLGHSGGVLGALLGSLGSLLGGLGAPRWDLLGSWVALGAILGRKGRFWQGKGGQKGGLLGGKTEPKSIQKQGANLETKKLHLGSGFG